MKGGGMRAIGLILIGIYFTTDPLFAADQENCLAFVQFEQQAACLARENQSLVADLAGQRAQLEALGRQVADLAGKALTRDAEFQIVETKSSPVLLCVEYGAGDASVIHARECKPGDTQKWTLK
jgi:hypothetical protein